MPKRTNIAIVLIAMLLFSVPSFGNEPILNGQLTQGATIIGKLPTGSRVWLNDDEIKISKEGHFVFGFGRDSKLTHRLKWQLAQQETIQEMPLKLSKREYKIDKIEGVAKKYVSPPAEVTKRIRQDNAAIAKARSTNSELSDFLDAFIMPAEGRISGVYGSQRFFNGEARRPHFGLDVANKIGTPVVAPVGGVVTLAHDDMYYSGGTLIVDHGFGISSTFIHLNKIHVSVGDRVEKGQLIAEIGDTGRVTGPHLDWRINWFKERLDPALLVEMSKK